MLKAASVCAIVIIFFLVSFADSGTCKIPVFEHGEIGRYETVRGPDYFGFRNASEFIAFQEGENVQHSETAFLRCNSVFISKDQATTSKESLMEVVCNNGVWSPMQYEAKMCSGEPPSIENGYPVVSKRDHGTVIWYRCNIGYVKVKVGDVKCDYGIWKGPTPVCGNSTCKIPILEHGEIGRYETVRGPDYSGFRNASQFIAFQAGENVKHSETVIVRCNSGFIPKDLATTSADSLMEVVCNDGVWDKPMQCEAKICSGEPPTIENGHPVVSNPDHGTVIWYKCNIGYAKVKFGDVKCDYGIWKGPTPVCAETPKCSTDILVSSLPDGVVADMSAVAEEFVEVVEYGTSIPLLCEEGLFRIGSSSAKCERWSNWEFGNVQCVPGCQLNKDVTTNSKVLINPVKEFYRFGDAILLSCPPGQQLSTSVVRVLCMGKTWSHDLPDCKENTQTSPSDYRETGTSAKIKNF